MKQGYLTVMAVVVGMLAFSPNLPAAEQDGIAVAIVFDTSGSMAETVRDGTGGYSPKYRVATRSLQAVANQLEAYSTNSGKKLNAGLFVFSSSGGREVIKMGPLNAESIRTWARQFNKPTGGTPLGAAIDAAASAAMRSGLTRKHVLVITDGINTVGKDPAATIPQIKRRAEQAQTSMAFHFVAFDVDAKVFAPVKKLGGTVVGAADEKQLNTQLQFILQQKILLEDEEPVKK